MLGDASFAGGSATAALGLALHCVNGIVMALVYDTAARSWPLLRLRPWLAGGAYGLVIYAVMNLVVIALSAASAGSRDVAWITLTIAVHVLLVGVLIAHAARLAARLRFAAPAAPTFPA